ncbi:MAG: hypothetical protein J5666_05675 [Bacilli bacterium]|nr:hypothetical protein [Bacilli bacterium]
MIKMKEKYELVKFSNGGVVIDVRVSPEENTVWLTQNQLVELFDSTKQNINLHINNVLNDGELDVSTVKEYLTVQLEGKRKVKRLIRNKRKKINNN